MWEHVQCTRMEWRCLLSTVCCLLCGVCGAVYRVGDGQRHEEHDGEVQVEELVLVPAVLGEE